MKPYYQDDYCTIYHGDCREILPEIGPVDLVLTDPPYGISYASSWKTRLGGQPRRRDSTFGPDVLETSALKYIFDAQNTDRALFLFTRWDVLHNWKAAAEAVGYRTRQRLIWNKLHWKMGDLEYYGSQIEDVLLFTKGRYPIFPKGKGRRGNIFCSSSSYLPEGQENHPTQKSIKTAKEFITDASKIGHIVLDPFMGSGTTLLAAKNLGRRAIGIEIEEKYCEIAVKRLRQEVLDFSGNGEVRAAV